MASEQWVGEPPASIGPSESTRDDALREGAATSVRIDGRLMLLRVLPTVLVFAILLVAIERDPSWIGWDAANYLQAADEVLAGRVPFVDIVDVNPPFVMFVNVLPALFHHLTGLGAAHSFSLWVTACAIACTYAFAWLLERLRPDIPADARWTMVFAFATANLIAWDRGHFGQREHFLILFLLPALIVRWARHDEKPIPRRIAAVAGFAGAFVLAMKPQYLLAVISFEAALFAAHRDFRRLAGPELAGVAAAAFVYLLPFAFYPRMTSEFFGFYLPIFARGYGAYDCSFSELVSRPELTFVLPVIALALARLPGSAAGGGLAVPLACMLGGAVIVYFLQHKGWPYHTLPALALTPLLLSVAVPLRPTVSHLCATALLLWFAATATSDERHLQPGAASRAGLTEYVKRHSEPGEAVLILSSSVLASHPMLLDLDRRPGSRFSWMPLLPMLYRDVDGNPFPYRRWDDAPADEQRLLGYLAEDVSARRPVIIAAERQGGQALAPSFSVAHWLNATGFQARAMSNYRHDSQIANFDIWLRKD